MSYEQYEANDAMATKSEIYVGRLASFSVSLENLKERFSPYGSITYIYLFNRGVMGLDAPVDAFAYIGFSNEEGGMPAINEQNGCTWLGQVIIVQLLDPHKAIIV